MKTLLTLFNLSELERRCEIPTGTLRQWHSGLRELPGSHKKSIEDLFSKADPKDLINYKLINQRELCRQAKISRSRFQRGLEDEAAGRFLRKKLSKFVPFINKMKT